MVFGPRVFSERIVPIQSLQRHRDRTWEEAGPRWRLHLGDARGRMEGLPKADLVLFDPFSPAMGLPWISWTFRHGV
jgi:hypothetical protein